LDVGAAGGQRDQGEQHERGEARTPSTRVQLEHSTESLSETAAARNRIQGRGAVASSCWRRSTKTFSSSSVFQPLPRCAPPCVTCSRSGGNIRWRSSLSSGRRRKSLSDMYTCTVPAFDSQGSIERRSQSDRISSPSLASCSCCAQGSTKA